MRWKLVAAVKLIISHWGRERTRLLHLKSRLTERASWKALPRLIYTTKKLMSLLSTAGTLKCQWMALGCLTTQSHLLALTNKEELKGSRSPSKWTLISRDNSPSQPEPSKTKDSKNLENPHGKRGCPNCLNKVPIGALSLSGQMAYLPMFRRTNHRDSSTNNPLSSYSPWLKTMISTLTGSTSQTLKPSSKS